MGSLKNVAPRVLNTHGFPQKKCLQLGAAVWPAIADKYIDELRTLLQKLKHY